MSKKSTVDRTAAPLTATSLADKLRGCGLADGQTVLVHMAMSKLGWIIGGAEAVILALLGAVGDSGTIMIVNGKRQWVKYETLNTDPDDFGDIGAAFDAAHSIAVQQIEDAEVRFFRQQLVVDFAVKRMEEHRDLSR